MSRSELELKIARITGAEVRNGKWFLAGRDFTLTMDWLVNQIEREVLEAIEPVVEAYNSKGKMDLSNKRRIKSEWSHLARQLEAITELHNELSS